MKEDILNDLVVVKRSGQRVSFNALKIAIAIKNAFDQIAIANSEKKVNYIYNEVLQYIRDNYKGRKTINVEDIQDIIETKLKENNFEEIYKTFNEYRLRRAISRKAFNLKHQHKFTKAIERIANESSENHYINSFPNDILLNFGKTISCEYAKNYILDSKIVRAHEEGSIYIHNLDYFWLGKISSTNIIINDNLLKDFPNNFIASLLSLKNEIDGEIAINKLDSLLKPVILKEFKKLLKKHIKMYLKITGIIEYINIKKINETIEKITTLNMDEKIFKEFILNKNIENIFIEAIDDSKEQVELFIQNGIRDILIILNNNYHENKKYSISLCTGSSFEELLINNKYIEELENLNYLENITTIIKIKKDNNVELMKRVYNLVLNKKNIAFAFCESAVNKDKKELVEYFGDGKRIFDNLNGEFRGSTGRMIISTISINMARLGIINENKKIEDFYKNYTEVLNLSKNGLVSIFEIIGDKTKKNYREIFKDNIIDDGKLEYNQTIRKVIKRGVLNLELAGLKECVLSLTAEEKLQKKLLKDIICFAKNKCEEFSKETKLNFIVGETSKFRPLKKLIELDKVIYGVKYNITDKKNYERIDSMFRFKKDINDDLIQMGEYQKHLSGGNLLKIKLNKNIKIKNIIEILELCKKSNIGFVKFVIGEEVEL
ncbi:MAG: hypothetical protein E7161_03475 [Firmicutes bacterium]|nr:hypothetical protein [Bacillota bacterium]